LRHIAIHAVISHIKTPSVSKNTWSLESDVIFKLWIIAAIRAANENFFARRVLKML